MILKVASVLPFFKYFPFDLELFVVAKHQGFSKFVEMPVQINERFTSTVSLWSVKQTLLDTLAIFYRLHLMHYYDRDISMNEVWNVDALSNCKGCDRGE